MKKTLITLAALAVSAGLSSATTFDLSTPPSWVTVSGAGSTDATLFGAPSYVLGQNETVTITFVSPQDVTFDIYDLDTYLGVTETATVDGVVYTGIGGGMETFSPQQHKEIDWNDAGK